MTPDLLKTVRAYSERIQDGRSLQDIHDHLYDELLELNTELYSYEPGEDGIAGEAIDVILCALDLIFKSAPDMTDAEIVAYADKKCQKWAKKYG
jgi:hypothetical protein